MKKIIQFVLIDKTKPNQTFLIMRLMIYLLLVAMLPTFATGYSQSTVLKFTEEPRTLANVIETIESQTEYRIFYKTDQISPERAVDIKKTDPTVAEALKTSFEGSDISYTVLGKMIVLAPAEKIIQAFKVTGTVTDESGATMPGVSVQIEGTTTGTVTDISGKYTIELPSENTVLIFSFIGYTPQKIAVKGETTINVTMLPEAQNLDQVVVVGYGTQKKATVTGSISDVKGDVLVKGTQPNLSNALVGKVAGVIAQQTAGGEPGNDASNIFIRGLSTTGDATPLIVIDGVANRPGGMDRLNSEDIESVTVLKDASAAIYGAQAANGVILVTTKRGKTGAPSISFRYDVTSSTMTKSPEMTDAPTFAQIQNEINKYNGLDPLWSADQIQKFADGSDPLNYPNTNWTDQALKTGGAISNKYNMSISGGLDKVNYYFSFLHINQDGMFKNGAIGYKQYNVTSNVDVQATKRLKISIDLNLRRENRQNSGYESNYIYQALIKSPPTETAVWPNGSPSNLAIGGDNPVFTGTEMYGLNTTSTDIALLNLKYKYNLPVSGLSVDGFFAFDVASINNKSFRKNYKEYSFDGTTYTTEKSYTRSLSKNYTGTQSFTANVKLRYEQTYGKHFINSFISYEQNEFNTDSYGASRTQGFLSDDPKLANLNLGAQVGQGLYGVSDAPSRRQNIFGRAAYSFSDKYMFEFSARYDGSYRFGSGNKWGFFPGASAGWRISEENFLKNTLPSVSNLKLRASYGLLGNDRISPFQYTKLYYIGAGPVFGPDLIRSIGIVPGVDPNPNVTWEKAKSYNAGFDLGLFDDKLTFTAEWFLQKRTDLLTTRNATVPSYTGIVLPAENIGSVQNTGFEVNTNYKNRVEDFNYSVGGNFVFSRNKVLFMDEPLSGPSYPEYQRLTGHTIGSWRWYRSDGIFNDQDEVDATDAKFPGTIPGDLKIVDINQDGELNDLDQETIDATDIPEITFGFNSSFSWKGWGLYFLFQGQAKSKHYFLWDTSPGQNYYNSFAENRWTEENTSSDNVRAFSGGFNAWGSDYWFRDASFIRLKNVELSYSLTSKFLEKIKISNARLIVSGMNLHTWTNYEPSVDPEISEFAGARYPLQRTVNLGIAITF